MLHTAGPIAPEPPTRPGTPVPCPSQGAQQGSTRNRLPDPRTTQTTGAARTAACGMRLAAEPTPDAAHLVGPGGWPVWVARVSEHRDRSFLVSGARQTVGLSACRPVGQTSAVVARGSTASTSVDDRRSGIITPVPSARSALLRPSGKVARGWRRVPRAGPKLLPLPQSRRTASLPAAALPMRYAHTAPRCSDARGRRRVPLTSISPNFKPLGTLGTALRYARPIGHHHVSLGLHGSGPRRRGCVLRHSCDPARAVQTMQLVSSGLGVVAAAVPRWLCACRSR